MMDKEKIKAHKSKIKSMKKAYSLLEEEALLHFRAAKSLHDEMEQIYNPFVDFDSIYSFADNFAENLLK